MCVSESANYPGLIRAYLFVRSVDLVVVVMLRENSKNTSSQLQNAFQRVLPPATSTVAAHQSDLRCA